MDYELLMNGNIKLGQKAPEFTADSTFVKVDVKLMRDSILVKRHVHLRKLLLKI